MTFLKEGALNANFKTVHRTIAKSCASTAAQIYSRATQKRAQKRREYYACLPIPIYNLTQPNRGEKTKPIQRGASKEEEKQKLTYWAFWIMCVRVCVFGVAKNNVRLSNRCVLLSGRS